MGGPVKKYGTTSDYKAQYSVGDVNRLFESFTDYQFTESNNSAQSDYGVQVSGEKVTFFPATEDHVRKASIRLAQYTGDKMEIYYTYSKTAPGESSKTAEKKAVLEPNTKGLYKIVSIEEVNDKTAESSQPEPQKQKTEDFPTGTYSYVAPVGGVRASMTIQPSGEVTVDMMMSGTGERDTISYTLKKGGSLSGGVQYTLKTSDGSEEDWEFVYYKDGDYFVEKFNVEEGQTDLRWTKA